jgi:cell division protein FtsQ
MKKSKGQTVDLLYENKKTKNKKSTRKKNTSKKENDKIINLDNEIIIGLTPKKEEKTKAKKRNNNKNKKNNIKKKNANKKKLQQSKNITKDKPKKRMWLKFVKLLFVILILLTAIVIFMLSSIFNIKEIKVVNNNKISTEEIINLSTLKIDNNMFKTTNKTIRNNIKTNAYIENVKIKRSINGIVTLDIIERKPTYMLKFANAYVYINNQGYMLEMSETPLELPTITGFETPSEQIKEGNRLEVNDLKKLEDIIKIMNSASETTLSSLITNIDISDANDYKLTITSENKVVNFGTATNINVKLLKIEEIIEKEKGKEGEIYFQNSEKTVFREKV